MEGDSVTLNADITQIQRDQQIVWIFESQTLIAEIEYGSIYDDYDERFRDRLKLDSQTGSLTITNIRITDSGHYQLKIINSRGTSYKRFSVTVNRVFGNEVTSLSVMEGDSVTLHTDITQIHRYDQIAWMFVSQDTAETLLLVEMIEKRSFIYDDDERFRNNLQLDSQTGSLTIKKLSRKHSGVYKVQINRMTSTASSNKTFNVTVYEPHLHYLTIVGSVVLLVTVVIIVGVCCFCCKKKCIWAREASTVFTCKNVKKYIIFNS
ncbi:uncharacterized protein [Paramisgurnus dabryanus]